MSLSTSTSSVGEVGPQVQTSLICCKLLHCVLSWSRDLTNFIFLDLVFWFRIKRDGVHAAMALTVEK